MNILVFTALIVFLAIVGFIFFCWKIYHPRQSLIQTLGPKPPTVADHALTTAQELSAIATRKLKDYSAHCCIDIEHIEMHRSPVWVKFVVFNLQAWYPEYEVSAVGGEDFSIVWKRKGKIDFEGMKLNDPVPAEIRK